MSKSTPRSLKDDTKWVALEVLLSEEMTRSGKNCNWLIEELEIRDGYETKSEEFAVLMRYG